MILKELILFCYAVATVFITDPVAIPSGPCGVVTDKKVSVAHDYLGILSSYKDESGEYFMRGGERCKLFTDAFMKE